MSEIDINPEAWRPADSAPKDGTPVRVLYADGAEEDGVYWQAEGRCCVLGSRAGSYPPGFTSTEAGHLPVRDITHWRPQKIADLTDRDRLAAEFEQIVGILEDRIGELNDAQATIAQRREESEWRGIETVPLVEDDEIELLTPIGAVTARYGPPQRHDTIEGTEYDGPAWVCYDDQFQIEIEWTPEGMGHGAVTHWRPFKRPLHTPPSEKSA